MLQTVLMITVIGMGLVFFAILLLWGMMELLVRLTNEKEKTPVVPVEEADGMAAISIPGQDTRKTASGKKKAAAAAVAAALRLRRKHAAILAVRAALAARASGDPVSNIGTPMPSHQSNWQPVNRAAQMQSRLRLFSRNSRRNSS